MNRAIGMGIITETTKSALLRLEGEKADLNKRIQYEQITDRRYTQVEIVASLEILGNYLSENDIQKRTLFETFVDKIVVDKDGKIVVNVDVFSTKAKIESIDEVVNGVREEKLVLRLRKIKDPENRLYSLSDWESSN